MEIKLAFTKCGNHHSSYISFHSIDDWADGITLLIEFLWDDLMLVKCWHWILIYIFTIQFEQSSIFNWNNIEKSFPYNSRNFNEDWSCTVKNYTSYGNENSDKSQ